MSEGAGIQELDGSELGTKEYWEKSYNTEIRNYKSHGDVGEVWFDEDSQFRVINWLIKNEIPEESSIIDLGCGNGMMLIELAREGYKNLTGIDYSPNAIELSKCIAEDQDLAIKYAVLDLLDPKDIQRQFPATKFDIIHDKGTYDAISLHPDNPAEKRSNYIENIHSMMNDSSLLILTSCNWTEDELCSSFTGKFVKHKAIPTPTFKFAGKVGSVVTSLVFKRI